MNFKKFVLKIVRVIIFDDIIKFEDFDFDKIVIDGKSSENIFIVNILYKTLINAKPLRINFDIRDGFIRVYVGTRCLVLLALKNLMPFALG